MTLSDFFSRHLDGCGKSDANRATGVSRAAIHDLATGKTKSPRLPTLQKLAKWSRSAGKKHGAEISIALTLGLKDVGES